MLPPDLDGRLLRLIRVPADEPGVALAVTRGPHVLWRGCAGLADLSRGVPIGPDTAFHVVSISKTYTAAAAIVLAASGALSLDDEARRHLPELSRVANGVTLRHLLSMTSGLRDAVEIERLRGVWRPDASRAQEIFELACRQPDVNAPPGAEYRYANSTWLLLEQILQRASGEPAEVLRRRLVYAPVGLEATHARPHEGIAVPRLAEPYARVGGGWQRTADLLGIAADPITTTIDDLARWILALRGSVIGGVRVTAAMSERARLRDGRPVHYGLGLAVRRYRGLTVLCHSGSQPGYKAHVAYIAARDLGLAILSNREDTVPTGIAVAVMDAVLGGDFPAPHPRTQAAERLAHSPMASLDPAIVAGTYVDASAGEWMELSIRNGALTAETLGDPITAYADQDGVFRDGDDYAATAPVQLSLRVAGSTGAMACDVDLGGRRWRGIRQPERNPLHAVAGQGFVGRYESASMASRHDIAAGRDGLIVHYGRDGDHGLGEAGVLPFPMAAIAPDVFLVRPTAPGVAHRHVFVFERDPGGRVVAARVTMERLKAVRLPRIS